MVAKKSKAVETLMPDEVHAQAAPESFFARLMNQFTQAWLFLTRIPLPGWWNTPDLSEGEGDQPEDKGVGMLPLSDTVRAWPLVGVLIGALSGGALWLGASAGLSPLAASFLGLIVAVIATGALHEDGLADVVDGFGGGADKTKKLKIMRDSHIGAYGVLALVMMVGFKAGVLSGFNDPALAAAALIVAHTLSRAVLPMMMVAMQPARRTGLGKAAGQPKRENAVMSAAIGVLIAVLALGPGPGLVAAALAGLGAAGVGWVANRQIGGYTGDVLGAAQQVSEALVLLGLAVVLRTVFYA